MVISDRSTPLVTGGQGMFDIHQSVQDRHGDLDHESVDAYIDGLMTEFAGSPEAKPIIEAHGVVQWSAVVIGFYFDYIGASLPAMTLGEFNEVVFSLLPAKFSTEPTNAEPIVTELRAFWSFLHRQYQLPQAASIADSLDETAARELHQELADSSNYGMAKSFVMMGIENGYDMATQEGITAFQLVYNERLRKMNSDMQPPPHFNPLLYLSGAIEGRPGGADLKKKRKEKRRQRQAKRRNRSR
jgi:hypothetical protein